MAIVEITYARDPASGAILFDASGYPKINPDSTANTLGDLQGRIKDEVLGSPTDAHIQNAINDAIAQYELESFWFNDMRTFGAITGSDSNLATTVGKEFYSYEDLPTIVNMPHIRQISILAFGNRFPLRERTNQWLEDMSFSPLWNGMPSDWAWQAGALRLYPIPNDAYPIILDGTVRFAPLSDPTDYNVWTNRAERLIRAEAKRLLFRDIIRDPDQTQAMELEVMGDPRTGRQGALAMLRRESSRRAGGTGRIRSHFV